LIILVSYSDVYMEGRSYEHLVVFGARVRERRTEEALSQQELAEQVGISRVYLSQIERGVAANPSQDVLNRVSERLGIYVSDAARSGGNRELPAGLAELKAKLNLPEGDIEMLLSIQFRGKSPKTVAQWENIYNIIEATSRTWE
jgi:transcriptional regulator with XRE-family HTH domain